MDLLNSIRKEGSRGGRADFKWEDVQTSQHRENYLGHSLMAPVGRWQKNKDLAWYAKGDSSSEAQSAAAARAEEIRRIKEAEQDALSAALGFPVAPKRAGDDATGANATAVKKALKESGVDEEEAVEEQEGGGNKGLGFGTFEGEKRAGEEREELGPMGWDDSRAGISGSGGRPSQRNHDRSRPRRRSRTPSPTRRHHRHHHHHHRHPRPRSSRSPRGRSRSRSRSRPPHRPRSGSRDRRRYRSRSPDRRSSRLHSRDKKRDRTRSPDRWRGQELSRGRYDRRDDRGDDRRDDRRVEVAPRNSYRMDPDPGMEGRGWRRRSRSPVGREGRGRDAEFGRR